MKEKNLSASKNSRRLLRIVLTSSTTYINKYTKIIKESASNYDIVGKQLYRV